ncbi:peptidoglycan recognition protein [Nocardioides caldifontis]|uniref:peptidoglycan recognition protein family protein n=1 Tax=Nocardioides caldifontis TaxID=2588938 RepID=UPI0011E01DEF|nr:peptidoglycan recognition protein [Nocardioides caldifontis]
MPNPNQRPVRRRPLLLALVGSGAALTGVGVAARTGLLPEGDGDDRADGVLRLAGSDPTMPALDLPLTDDLLQPQGTRQWTTGRLDTTTFTMVGATWRHGEVEPVVEVSTRVDGAWQSWQPLPHVHLPVDGAEAASGAARDGTDVAWTGPADGVRVRVRGQRPADLQLVLLHPEPLPADTAVGAAGTSRVTAGSRSRTDPLRPEFLGRRHWGAKERWRNGGPSYNATIKQVHVHHTANSNSYSRKDVPAMIRGMYRYHTKSLGWSDIGYNFLVDKFGRIWVGRAGGPRKAVRGAHTLGFNGKSTGVAVIGNFETAVPSNQVLNALARIAAWKLHMYGRNPRGRVRVVSEGSDRFRDGRRVELPVIDGHRDTNQTACPGKHLYHALPKVRRRAKRRIARLAT